MEADQLKSDVFLIRLTAMIFRKLSLKNPIFHEKIQIREKSKMAVKPLNSRTNQDANS